MVLKININFIYENQDLQSKSQKKKNKRNPRERREEKNYCSKNE